MARSRLLASVAAMGALALAGGATFGKSIVQRERDKSAERGRGGGTEFRREF